MSFLPTTSAVLGGVLSARAVGLEVADEVLEIVAFPQRLEGRVGAKPMAVVEAGGRRGSGGPAPPARRGQGSCHLPPLQRRGWQRARWRARSCARARVLLPAECREELAQGDPGEVGSGTNRRSSPDETSDADGLAEPPGPLPGLGPTPESRPPGKRGAWPESRLAATCRGRRASSAGGTGARLMLARFGVVQAPAGPLPPLDVTRSCSVRTAISLW